MRISEVVCFDISTGRELYRESYEYSGPVERLCGASRGMKEAANMEQSVSQQMTNEFGTVFNQDEGILNSLTSALTPIVSAGPNQQGFSPAEEAAMRTQSMDSTAAAGQQASNSVRQEEASEGSGNTYLPSGSEAAINAGIAENTAQTNATNQLNITNEDYAQGRQNFFNAVEQHPEVSFLVNSTHCEIHGDGPTIFRQFIVRPEPGFPSRLGEAKRYGGTYRRAGVITTERNAWQFVGHRKEILQLCREGREAIEQFAREVILTHRANVQLGQAGSTHQVGQSNLQ